MNGVCCWSNLKKNKNHIIICYILYCCQVLAYLENYKIVWTSWWRTVSLVEDNGLCAISFQQISSKLLCIFYMMFLDAWVIVLSVYEYFMLFFISLILLVYSLKFLRKQIHKIYTILLFSKKKISTFFPFGIVFFVFFF